MRWTLAGATRLVGRDAELQQVQAVIDRLRPALLVVRGAPGAGKGTFLAQVAERVAALGWATARTSSAGESLAAEPAMTAEDLCGRLRRALREPADSLRLAPPDGAAGAAEPTPAPLQPAPTSTASLAAPPQLGRVARALVEGGRPSLDPCVEALRAVAPVLVVLDDYRPGPALAAWFERTFVADLARCDGLVVVAITDRGGVPSSLRQRADLTLTLRRPDARAVQRHLQEAAAALAPPLTRAEVREYARAASERPELLDSFARLFRLAASTGVGGS